MFKFAFILPLAATLKILVSLLKQPTQFLLCSQVDICCPTAKFDCSYIHFFLQVYGSPLQYSCLAGYSPPGLQRDGHNLATITYSTHIHFYFFLQVFRRWGACPPFYILALFSLQVPWDLVLTLFLLFLASSSSSFLAPTFQIKTTL